MEFNDPKEIDDPQVFDDPKEISVYGLWFSKLYGATSINDGLDVFFFILLVFSIIDCGR